MKYKNTFVTAARGFLAVLLLLTALPLLAGEHKPQENRFLFIVNTSSALKKYYNAEIEDIVDLLGSNMRGELRDGDTLGLWTYDELLHTEYPMQVWSKDDKSAIMTEMAAYLRGRRYDSRGHLEKVGPALNNVIKASERLTVILIFDGTTPVHGTPFDVEINMLQKKYARELKAERKPFVLVLVAREGTIDDFTINYPGPVTIPHTAYPEPIETNKPPVAATPPPAAETNGPMKLREGPSIFISGPKTSQSPASPVLVTTTAPPPVTTSVIVATIPSTPPPSPILQPQPPIQPAPKPTPAPAPVVAATPPPAPVVATPPAPVTTPPAQPAPQVVSTPAPAPVTPPAAPVAAQQNTEPTKEAAPAETSWPQPKPAAVAAATPASSAPAGLFVMALLLLTVAVVLAVFLLRRNRRPPQSSLITQTIERPRPR